MNMNQNSNSSHASACCIVDMKGGRNKFSLVLVLVGRCSTVDVG